MGNRARFCDTSAGGPLCQRREAAGEKQNSPAEGPGCDELRCRCGRSALVEDDGAVVHVDVDRAALREAAFEDGETERVEDVVLDGALERAGTVDGVVAVLGHQLCGGVAELELEPAGSEALVDASQLDVDDALEIRAFKAVEDDDFIDAVEELGAEVPAQGIQRLGVA